MASTTTRNLFLQVNGSADGLSRAAKAARLSLAQIGADASDMQRVVAENFQRLGSDGMAQTARQIEANLRRTFQNIRASAEQNLNEPLSAAGIANINVRGAEQQLASAEATAAAYRQLADAQTQIVTSGGAVAAGQRELAIALEAQALAAREDVVGLEQQLTTLRQLQAALGITADAEDEAAGAHNRMGASGLIVDHVVRSFTDSIAAGQSPVRALTMEMGRITEAMQLFALQTNATEGAMGRFAGFMGSGWGIAVTIAITAAAALAQSLMEGAGAADKDTKAHDELKEALDRLAGAAAAANHETRQGIIDDLNAATAARQHAAAEREKLAAKLASARADLAGNSAPQVGGMGVTVGNPSAGAAASNIADLDKQMADNAAKIQGINKDILAGSAKLIIRDAAGAADPRTGANQRYEDAKDALQRRYEKGGIKPDDFSAQLAALDAQHADEMDELRRRQKKPRADHTAERAANVDRAYQAQVDQAQEAYSRAMLGLSDTAQQRYEVEVQSLQDRLKQRLLEINDLVTAKKIPGKTAAEVQANADYLRSLAQQTKILEEQNALRKEMSDLLNQQFAVVKAQMDAGMTDLQLRLSGATGRRNQYAIAQQLLDKQQQADYADLINKMDPANMDVSETDRAKAYVDYLNLPTKQAQEKSNLAKQYASPGQSYLEQLRSSSGDMKDALQSVQVDGLKGLEDGLTGVITGTKSVQAAFKSMATSIIADLARIAIEREIITPIANALFPTSGSGGGSGGGIFGLLGSLFGGHRAGGGPVSAGKVYRVGERGEEWFAPSTAGTIIPNHAIPQMASLSNADVRSLNRPQQPILISVRRGEMFEPYVHGAAAQHAQVAYSNATEDGANLAASRSAWSQGRALGGTR